MRRAALRARRSGRVWSGKFRRGPRQRLNARDTADRRKLGDGEFGHDRSRRDERHTGGRAAVDAGAAAVLIVARTGGGVIRLGRATARYLVAMRGVSLSGFADRRELGALATKRRDDGAGGAMHRTRLQQSRLPRDKRKPNGEQGRQRPKPSLAASHNR